MLIAVQDHSDEETTYITNVSNNMKDEDIEKLLSEFFDLNAIS